MKTSIVLSTYNGEKFIEEQLNSLLAQTRQPDGVIIVDDCSTDSTPEKCRNFIKEHDLTNWMFNVNTTNKGWADNFSDAFLLAEGDLIFPCDQDDIWLENKIELMAKVMEDNDKIGLLIGSYHTWVQNETEDRIVEKVHTNELKILPFDETILYVNHPGCVFCFRKDFYNKIAPYRFAKYPHDSLLIRMSRLSDCCYTLDTPVIKWRRHTANATGKPIRTNEDMRGNIKYYLDCFEKMKEFCQDNDMKDKLPVIDKNIEFQNIRYKAFEKHRFVGKDSLFSCIKYLNCYNRPLSILGDAWRMVH